jgi:hypothetical protein
VKLNSIEEKKYSKYEVTYQIMPSKMFATVKEDCAKTTNKIMWVHAYCPN